MRSNVSGMGYYNSEPRNFNRGFGRGNQRPYYSSQRQPSPQAPRRGDVFVEAGRLAVDYLVSHGLLSSNVLLGKCQNGSLKNNNADTLDLRSSQDREPSNPLDSRSARPRAATPDGVSSIRRSPNEQDMNMSRNYSRDRRRYGSSRSYSSDWSRENGREGFLPEKETSSEAMEADYSKNCKGDSKYANINVCNSESVVPGIKDGEHSDSKQEIKMGSPPLDSESMTTSSSPRKDAEELPEPADEVNVGSEEAKDVCVNHEKEQKTQQNESPSLSQHSELKNAASSENKMHLTMVNSSLMNERPNGDPLVTREESNIIETGHDPLDTTKGDTLSSSSGISCLSEVPTSNYLGVGLSDHAFRDTGTLDPGFAANHLNSVGSLSFTGRTFSFEEKVDGLPELGMCSSIGKDRGEKRAVDEDNMMEGDKKAKQWLTVAQSNDHFQLSDLSDKHSFLPENRSMNMFNDSANQDRVTNVSLPPEGSVESSMAQGEEKQLFTSSYKICDLNLIEASEMHENHGIAAPDLLYSSKSAPNKNTQVVIDLSMNNNCSFNNGYNDSSSVRKDIVFIDLESASVEEGKSSNASARNLEAGLTSMENYPNNPQNPNDNPDGSDGYGFMISELLCNDVPNCSSVQPDLNSLQNDMGLHHGQGMFSEDDPIYMSLGEIPLTGLLRAWEQPTQEKNPFEL